MIAGCRKKLMILKKINLDVLNSIRLRDDTWVSLTNWSECSSTMETKTMATTSERNTTAVATEPKKRGGKRGPRNATATVTNNLEAAQARLKTAAKGLFELNKMDRVNELQTLITTIETFKTSLKS